MDATDSPLFNLAARVTRAAVPEDLFGPLAGEAGARRRALASQYRRLAARLHPDRYRDPACARVAREAFLRLAELLSAAEAKLGAGTYGDRTAAPSPVVLCAGSRSYRVGPRVARGDLCDVYASHGSAGAPLVLKVLGRPSDADLALNESRVLGRLAPAGTPDRRFHRYLPRLVDSFVLRGASGGERRVNVLPHFADHVSLEEVLAAHPAGLDLRDVAWMLKRLLAGLGFVHRRGFVHGAVVPPHVLVHPVEHGARLVDFCYAVDTGTRIAALSPAWRAFYPPEVTAKQPATPATDIAMAAACAVALLGGDVTARTVPSRVPAPLATFLRCCLAPSPARRPDDAWQLHEELDELLLRLVGEPRYRPLAMPSRARKETEPWEAADGVTTFTATAST